MSIQVMSLIWKHAKVSGSELLVLLAMADYGDDDGKHIFPSMKTLGDKARLSEDQTRRVLKRLEKQKLIRLVEMGGWRDGRNWANEYELRVDNIAKTGVQDATSLQDATTLQDATSPRRRNHRGSANATTVPAQMQPQSPLQPLVQPPSGEDAAAPPTPQQELFGAVCEAVGWDYRTLTKEDQGQVAQTCGILGKAGYAAGDVATFMQAVWFKDWRWQKNQALPTIKQLRQEIGKIRSTVPAAAPASVGKNLQGVADYINRQRSAS